VNYIVWQDQDSRNIPGLLICELPAISRSKMRTQVTEIEGKDGDISDNIGYASYDKTLKIALTKNYDINAIAKYFTGSGKVNFSNEIDKYYHAEITEQIDFERLLKFKTATVKFHIQPFKYLADEEPVSHNIENETEISVVNKGLEPSKPIITLFGKGIVEIAINGYAQFQVDIDDSFLTINSEIEECYMNTLTTLKNRNMTGVFPFLQPGKNVITWAGNLTKIKIYPRSRWL